MAVAVSGPSVGMSSGVPPDNARIATGTYTGDGAVSLAITGVGFTPKMVFIGGADVDDSDVGSFIKLDSTPVDMSHMLWAELTRDNRLISLDADGFTVGDDGTDSDPNKLNQLYCYMALG